MSSLQGKVAVITGASSGIGKAIALSLALEGANVLLLGRNESKLNEVARLIQSRGGHAAVFVFDVTLMDENTELQERFKKQFGRVDVLVHSAGAFVQNKMDSASIDDFDLQYRVNVRGAYYLTQALLTMITSYRGQIVFINSTAGIMGARANVGQYAATKHALRAIADSVRDEVNSKGVRVLSVYPGRTASAMQEAIHKEEGLEYHPEQLMQPEDVASVVKMALCLPETAEMTDVTVRPMKKIAT